jgi:hypothetical protein
MKISTQINRATSETQLLRGPIHPLPRASNTKETDSYRKNTCGTLQGGERWLK